MSEISLVLPFALPPPELSADLARVLKAPALAVMLAKTSSTARIDADPAIRMLPHEQWLGATESGGSFLVHPGHIEIARSHLAWHDLRRLHLSDAHSRALYAAAAPMFAELGLVLDYERADTWRLKAEAWAGLDCASPDAAAGLDIADWLPKGEAAIKFRKLQNEIQMLWFEHPANAERERSGLQPVNAFWPWRGCKQPDGPGSAARLLSMPPPATALCDDLTAPALANDWGAWLPAMEQVDQQWLAPLLDALRAGKLKRLRLLRGGREHLSESIITPGSLRKFWRAPSLARLAT